MISIAHRIELCPNNKQKTYFRKAFGVSRFVYNWGLAEWERRFETGERRSFVELSNCFNAIKKEQFPFVYEVTKYASSQALRDVEKAYKNFVNGTAKQPKPKKKRDNGGSFYFAEVRLVDFNPNSKSFKKIAHNVAGKHQYLRVPNLGYVKMTERLRFNGKIVSVTISQHGDRFFASFSMQITREEYLRTHPSVSERMHQGPVGVDLGIKSAMVLSNGMEVVNPRIWQRYKIRVKKKQRQLSRCVHARNAQEREEGVAKSANYLKKSRQLSNLMRKCVNTRKDFIQKVTSIITTQHTHIVMENLDVVGMVRNSPTPQDVLDMSFYDIRETITYKSLLNGVEFIMSDRYYPSSKMCSECGYVKKNLRVNERSWVCPNCGVIHNRDLNAAVNLVRYAFPGLPVIDSKGCNAEILLFEKNEIEIKRIS